MPGFLKTPVGDSLRQKNERKYTCRLRVVDRCRKLCIWSVDKWLFHAIIDEFMYKYTKILLKNSFTICNPYLVDMDKKMGLKGKNMAQFNKNVKFV